MYFLHVINSEEASLDLYFASFIITHVKFWLQIILLSYKLEDNLYFRNFKEIKEKYTRGS